MLENTGHDNVIFQTLTKVLRIGGFGILMFMNIC